MCCHVHGNAKKSYSLAFAHSLTLVGTLTVVGTHFLTVVGTQASVRGLSSLQRHSGRAASHTHKGRPAPILLLVAFCGRRQCHISTKEGAREKVKAALPSGASPIRAPSYLTPPCVLDHLPEGLILPAAAGSQPSM